MNQFDQNNVFNRSSVTFNTFLSNVFSKLAIGLLVSGVIAALVSINYYNIIALVGAGSFAIFMIIALVAELVVGISFSARLMKMSKSAAWGCYIAYSALTGLSLALIIQNYTTGSVVFAFGATVIMFTCMAIIGHNSNVDLTRFGTIAMVGLVAIIITSLLNALLFKSLMVNYLISVVGVLIFLGLIAYDMQKLKQFYERGSYDLEFQEKMMIYGAFTLYLDFINLFIRILQIFGKGRSNKN